MMKNLNSSDEIDNETILNEKEYDIAIPYPVRFWLYLISFIPSLICYFFVLWHYLFDRTLRHNVTNHTIIILLVVNIIYELTNIPFYLVYFHYFGNVVPSSSAFCLFWIFIDEALFSVSLFLIAWAAVERYIFIFHKRWISTLKTRILVHYCPLACLIIYLLLFYFFTVLFPPCENEFNYEEPVCGSSMCFYDISLAGIWDTIFNDILPILVIVVFNLTLFFRVILGKRRFVQLFEWRKYQKMSIQLLAISALYFFLHIPDMAVELIELAGISTDSMAEFQLYLEFFSCYSNFLLPFATAVSMPNLKEKIKRLFLCQFFQPIRREQVGVTFIENKLVRPKNTVRPTENI